MYVLIFGFILGAILGSGAKALADRSLNDKSFWGRSYCPNCKKKLQWYDLLPVLSYLLIRGKCRYCKEKIGVEYLLVEVTVGLLVAFLFWQTFQNFKFTPPTGTYNFHFQTSLLMLTVIFQSFFITVLSIIFLTDLKKMFIPDRIVLPSIIVGTVLGLILVVVKVGYLYYTLQQSRIGKLLLPPHSDYLQRHVLMTAEPFLWSLLIGLAIAGFFLSLIIITKGKGMGGGDVKLGAFIGVMLGFPQALFAVVMAFIIGALFSLGLIFSGKKHFGESVPFGPFLVLGSLIMLFWGNQIVDWYLQFSIK